MANQKTKSPQVKEDSNVQTKMIPIIPLLKDSSQERLLSVWHENNLLKLICLRFFE